MSSILFTLWLHSSLKIGINIPKDFCGTGAFGAGLTTLDGLMPTFLYHVLLASPKNLQQQWGGLQSTSR